MCSYFSEIRPGLYSVDHIWLFTTVTKFILNFSIFLFFFFYFPIMKPKLIIHSIDLEYPFALTPQISFFN